jgi:hypothetical protein
MSKRLLAVSLLLLVLSSAPAALAAPADDHDPGVLGRIERIAAKVARAVVRGLVPFDGLTWPKP